MAVERFYSKPEDYFFLECTSNKEELEGNNTPSIKETKIANTYDSNCLEEHFSNIDFYNNNDKKVDLNTNITKSINESYEKLFYEHEKEQKEYSTQSLCVIGQEKEVSKEDAVFEQIVGTIRETNGHEVSVNALIESLRMQNEHVKECFGHVAIQKDSPNVKNMYLNIIRHNNIEVVRHKPDLVVKWVKEEDTEHQLSSDYDENAYRKQHQQDNVTTNTEALQ